MEIAPIDSPQFALSGSCLAGAHAYARKRNMKMASIVGEGVAVTSVSWRC